VGDDEVPSDNPPIDVGGPVSIVTTGVLHTCAILAGEDGRVRCWGMGLLGVLGYGNTQAIGDNEAPRSAGDVTLFGAAVGLQAYEEGNCVLLESGDSRCWGEGQYGDNEPAGVAPLLQLGGAPSDLAGGPRCALTSDGSVRCWGRNDSGELGLGHTDTVTPGGILEAGPAVLGAKVEKLARGFVGLTDAHTCALLEEGAVRCWGNNEAGQLGLGHRENVGDDEVPADEPTSRVLE
jgi:alpha-tubulin suppressor-like RCC1 family protein